MKLLLPFIAVVVINLSCASESEVADESANESKVIKEQPEFDLHKLIGKDLEHEKVVEFKNSLGNFDAEDVGKYPHIMFYGGGVELVYEAETNKVASIFLMGPEHDKWFKTYAGSLPEGLKWGMSRAEVEKKIGKGEQRKTYGGEIVMMYKDKYFEIEYGTEDESDMNVPLEVILIQDFDE